MTATQNTVTVDVSPEVATLRVADIVLVFRFAAVKKWAAQKIKKHRRGVYMMPNGETVELFADMYDANILRDWADFSNWMAHYYAEDRIGNIAETYYRQNGEPMTAELRREVVKQIKAIAAHEIEAAKAELDK